MNTHDAAPTREEADADLAVREEVNPAALIGYPELSADYPSDFVADEAYKAGLPDLQNGPSSLIVGEKTLIQHVGISNFRLPIRYHTRDGADVVLETSVTGTVSLEAEKKGINMSRIMRSFYAYAEKSFSYKVIERALEDYKRDLDSFDARIQMRFSFPMKIESLRSGLSGWNITILRWNWLMWAACAKPSCIWIMSIPALALVRWSCPNMRAARGHSLPLRTASGLWRGSRWSWWAINACGLKTLSTLRGRGCPLKRK